MTEHKTIFEALSAATGEVRIIGKTDENKFDKYNFASIDKFLEMVNPICSRHGLFPFMTETSYEHFTNAKGTPWVRVTYEITMFHSSGQTFGPSTRAVAVPMNGAQAYGSAQSYVLKQYFRSLFMIPTGDKDDADLNATDSTLQPKSNPQAEGLADAWRDGVLDRLPENASPRVKAEAFATAICDDFKGKGQKALDNRWARHEKMIARFQSDYPDLWEKIVDAFETRRNELIDGDRVAAE